MSLLHAHIPVLIAPALAGQGGSAAGRTGSGRDSAVRCPRSLTTSGRVK